MGFLQGLAQTLDLQPAAQAFVQARRRAEDRKQELEDEERAWQEKMASIGAESTGDRAQDLGLYAEYHSPDASAVRNFRAAAIEQGLGDTTDPETGVITSAEDQYRDFLGQKRAQDLEAGNLALEKTEASIPGTDRWWEAQDQEAIVKDRDAFRSIAQTAFGLGFDIRTKDGLVNQEEMDKYLAFAKRTSDAVTKSKEALAKYYEKDRTPAGVLKLEQAQQRIEAHLPQWMAEMRYYEDSPDKERLEAYIKDYGIPGGQSDAKFKLIQDLFIEVRQQQAERHGAYKAAQRQASADNPGWGVLAPLDPTNQASAPRSIETWTPSFTSSPAPVEAPSAPVTTPTETAPAPGATPPPAAAGASVDTLGMGPAAAPGEASPAFGNMTDAELQEWVMSREVLWSAEGRNNQNTQGYEAAIEEMKKRPAFKSLFSTGG